MKVYVASSWRNTRQPEVVNVLRAVGHEVYDFKQPTPGDNGFHWSEIDPDWKQWGPGAFDKALDHPIAKAGFKKDMDALENCDALVLVMPCGRSAHLEAGFAIGADKPTAILLDDSGEPELMYKMAKVCTKLCDVVYFLENCCHYEAVGGFNVPRVPWCQHTRRTATASALATATK